MKPSDLEHTAKSDISQSTTLSGLTDGETISVEDFSVDPVSAKSTTELVKDVEIALDEAECEPISIWTWKTCGLPLSAFLLAFLNAIASGIVYGFFLGYMGLDSYVMSSIAALMKLPEVFLLPIGMINDCFPIFGYHRKPYLVASWFISGGALLAMSLRRLPAPYYCQFPDGSYDWMSPPCNPDIHLEKNWYIFPLFVLIAGAQVGSVAGEGLLLEYSQREPAEHRGQIKAEMTMVVTAGSLTASLVIGLLLNGKAYLGTFDWGLSFSGLMTMCLAMVVFIIPVSLLFVYEPRKITHPSFSGHAKSSWKLVKGKALSSILFFAFLVQFLVASATTATPMVQSQWAGVKVLQQQLFGTAGMFVMMLATWIYKVYFLQTSWRKAILVAILTVSVVDAIPSFLTIFGVVRNQYFYLGEGVVGNVPKAALALVSNLMIIELSEPGCEGMCYGLAGTMQNAASPLATVVSNQVYGLFSPSLSKLENYVADTPQFRSTVAWSYALTYATTLLSFGALPLIPKQKEDARRRKREWKSSPITATLVLGVPAICLVYGVTVLLLTSQPETACLRWVGGQGCENET